ncbi:hypothetical protein HYS93_01330 [Candidatus Daviesbacteria bacterium]|nr:hypothetical protein [Candidatus Daviesbacteria bacterium]
MTNFSQKHFKHQKPNLNYQKANFLTSKKIKRLLMVIDIMAIIVFVGVLLGIKNPSVPREFLDSQLLDKGQNLPNSTSSAKSATDSSAKSTPRPSSSVQNNQGGVKKEEQSELSQSLANNFTVPDDFQPRREQIQLFGIKDIGNLKAYSGNEMFNIKQGTIKFSVKADWPIEGGDKDRTLVLASYNNSDNRGAFIIAGSGRLLVFDTYDNNGHSGSDDPEPDADLGSDYQGKTFEVTLTWDFTGEKRVKKIFINGVLKVETNPERIATRKNNSIFIGPIEDLTLSKP